MFNRNAYRYWSPKQQKAAATTFKPTVLKSASTRDPKPKSDPVEAWQLQLKMDDGQFDCRELS